MTLTGATPGVVPAARSRLVLARLRRLPWGTAIAILAIAILSWPVADGSARTGLDPSWEAAFHLAIAHGVRFGPELVFTYGPLGFLAWAWPWYGPSTLLSLAFVGAIHVAICGVVFIGARRALPMWQAVIVAYLAARAAMVLQPFEALLILVFAGCAAVSLRRGDRPSAWVVVLGGVVTAVGLLGKLNAGVFIAAIVLVTVFATFRPRRRGVLVFAASVSATFLGLWLVTGQGPADIPAYLAGSFEIVRGYSEAMGGPGNDVVMLAYLLLVLVVARIAAVEARDRPRADRIGLLLVGGLMAFAFFKTGFVRWNIGYTMSAVIVGLFAVVSGKTPRSFVLGAFVAVLVVSVATARTSSPVLAAPTTAVRSLVRESVVAGRPWSWTAAEQRTREELRARYALDPAILDALRGHTVHVDPWETAVLFAWPELLWRPLPVFQSYSAYTPALDELNASVLRGPDAPQRILRQTDGLWPGRSSPSPATILGRDRWFEAPAAMLETFCRYDEVAATPLWEVLALTSRRCGTPELLSTVVAQPEETVTVPTDSRPDRLVVVRVHGVDDRLVDRLVTGLYKSSQWYVALDDTDPYRLVPGTAVDGLLMAVPASIARSPGFAFGPPTRSIAIAPRDAFAGPGPLTYEFLSVPLLRP